MKTRKLGPNDPELSAVGLGCMGMSAFYGGRDGGGSVRTLHGAVELGVTFFDSAAAYANGANEELVGHELKGVRDRVFLATKFASTWGPNGERTGISGKPDYVGSACDASLKRLGVDVIDLYYQHRVDPSAGARYQQRYWHEQQFETIEALRHVAAEADMSMATMGMRWVISNPAITAPIIGASRPEQLGDSLAAAEQGPLPSDLKAKLDDISLGWRLVDEDR